MNASKKLTFAAAVGVTLAVVAALPARAQTMDQSKTPTASSAAADMTDGEIKKVDKDNKKLTIKHGDIKSLDMPGMTMVFQVKDPAMLEQVKTGDKIRFKVEKANGAMVVTEIQAAGK
ncbi:copper-binding protein [Roseateles sp.]|uniref:copper-binding protein n=1 Tax=Roseateles sp. TaxID=1971397 RepID=UPI003265F898